MDTTKTITHLGLCAGYGGIELGLKRVLPALRTVALCEIEAFAIANLVAKMETGLMDPAPIWTNLKTFPWESFRDRVDVLTGGYPCQPFSSAGKRLGTDDPRHLWPYIAGGIRILKPKVCFFENVEGHITLGLSTVISDLEELGYEVSWGIFSAAEVGAPHQRKRVFIMAYRNDTGLERYRRHVEEHDSEGRQEADGHAWPSRPGEPQHAWEPPRVVADARHQQPSGRDNAADGQQPATGWVPRGQPPSCSGEPSKSARESMGNATDAGQPQRWSGSMGQPRAQQEPQRPDCGNDSAECKTQPPLGRNTDGSASGLDYAELSVSCDNRTDELRLLGNGVVPATVAKAYITLLHDLDTNIPRECGL